MIYEDRERLMRALQVNTEGRYRELGIDDAARDCVKALLAGDLAVAQKHAQHYSELKRGAAFV